MPESLVVKLITAIAFGTQFLIFAHLYSSHRIEFFRYLVWGWGLSLLGKVAGVSGVLFPQLEGAAALAVVASIGADLCVFVASLAFRWHYRLRWPHALAGLAFGIVLALLNDLPSTAELVRTPTRVLAGLLLIAAGAVFWPARTGRAPYRGVRFLAGSLGLWGAYRVVMPFLNTQPGTDAYHAAHVLMILLYFLTVFAIIFMVLDRARSEMASLKQFNETLVDGLGEGLELVDETFAVQHANRWLVDQFGPVAGRRCYEVLTADRRPCPGCPMAGRHDMTAPARLEIAGPAGRQFLLTCSPLRQPNGRVFLLELVADVTEQERLRARLTEAERLAAAGELAASVAHEIRNPLAAIVNAASLLEEEETLSRDERAGTLAALKKEARRLNAILSDFLVFSRRRKPRRQPGDVRQVVDHVAKLIREGRARTEGVRATVRAEPNVPTFAFDADQLTQVLWNIALNGVQAMDGRGELRLEVTREDGEVLIAVSDTGRGISPDERSRMFEPFYSKKQGGTGLGLSIARQIVSSHGGRIDVESTSDGSRFTVRLPLGES